jgi:hypothetical protein
VGNLPCCGGQRRESGANPAYAPFTSMGGGKRFGARWEGPAAHQVVGGVTAHQAGDGSLV